MFSMPPATMTSASPGTDDLRRQRDGLQAGAAEHVDRRRRHLDRQPGADRGLPGRVLPQARLQHAAEQYLLDVLRGDLRPLERRFDRAAGQLGSGNVLEITAEGADRRPDGAYDDRLLHVLPPYSPTARLDAIGTRDVRKAAPLGSLVDVASRGGVARRVVARCRAGRRVALVARAREQPVGVARPPGVPRPRSASRSHACGSGPGSGPAK